MSAREDYPVLVNGLLRSNRVYADEVYQLKKLLDQVDRLTSERDTIHDRYDEMRSRYCAKVDEVEALRAEVAKAYTLGEQAITALQARGTA